MNIHTILSRGSKVVLFSLFMFMVPVQASFNIACGFRASLPLPQVIVPAPTYIYTEPATCYHVPVTSIEHRKMVCHAPRRFERKSRQQHYNSCMPTNPCRPRQPRRDLFPPQPVACYTTNYCHVPTPCRVVVEHRCVPSFFDCMYRIFGW
jgi:hypothetical protein